MNRSEKVLLQLYHCMFEYAQMRGAEYGLSSWEVEDIVSSAYLKAQNKMRNVQIRNNRLSAIRSIAWTELMDGLDRSNRMSERILREAVRLDAGTKDGSTASSIDITDGKLTSSVEHIEPEVIDWVTLTRDQIQRERGIDRRVVTQLQKEGMSYAKIRNSFRLSRGKFYAILKKLRIDFAQCFKAYQQCLAEEFATRFQIHPVYIYRETVKDEDND